MPYNDQVNGKRTMDHFAVNPQVEELIDITDADDEMMATLFEVTVDQWQAWVNDAKPLD